MSSDHAGRVLSRRDALTWLGAAGLTGLAAACGSSGTKAASASRATTSTSAADLSAGVADTTTVASTTCVLTPELTEGPYYIAGEAIRTDITEGKAGMPLRLALVVSNISRCTGVANASIDIWHADAGGNYSGFNATASNRTFLRGTQVTDASGAAGFHTIYPGWYSGRATHIHVKVHVAGNVVHTGQLFFDEATNTAVYATAPYNSHGGTRTMNSQDSIYNGGGSQSIVRVSQEGSGLVGTITMGVRI